jgi:hypothetical protein
LVIIFSGIAVAQPPGFDSLVAAAVDVDRGEIAQALVMALLVVVPDERLDLDFEACRKEVAIHRHRDVSSLQSCLETGQRQLMAQTGLSGLPTLESAFGYKAVIRLRHTLRQFATRIKHALHLLNATRRVPSAVFARLQGISATPVH